MRPCSTPTSRTRTEGFTVLELVVAMSLSVVVMLAILSAYSQGSSIKAHVQGTLEIHSNLRLAMDRLSRELRMTGHRVPRGFEVGGTASWSPAIFHAAQTEIGFRSDLDGGNAEIVCTPLSTNTSCPLSKLRLDSIDYYEDLNCQSPDGAVGGLKLIALDEERWKGFTCSGFSLSDDSISVSGVPNGTFEAGTAEVATIEQVYFRYLPATEPPYGTLVRGIVYGNAPDDTFPASGIAWTTIADHLTDFWMEYQDVDGTVLSGSTLDPTQRALVRKIVLFLEGYDRVGVDGHPQLLQVRSEVLVRNLSI